MLTSSLPVRQVSEFAADVRESLTKPGQRELPSKYLYDEVGSALFEAICVLPCLKSMRERLWGGCRRRFRSRSSAVAQGKRRDGS